MTLNTAWVYEPQTAQAAWSPVYEEFLAVSKIVTEERSIKKKESVPHLWFLFLYLLQEIIVLLHQLIVALRLRLLQLKTDRLSFIKHFVIF